MRSSGFEDPDVVRLLSDRGSALSQLDLRRFESRRFRARIAKLMESAGVAAAGHAVPLPALGDEPPRVPRCPALRSMLADELPRWRVLLLPNRADESLERGTAEGSTSSSA